MYERKSRHNECNTRFSRVDLELRWLGKGNESPVVSQYRGQSRWFGSQSTSTPGHPFEPSCQALFSLTLDLLMPLQTPETLLLTFFSCSQTTLSFALLLLFALFALTLLLHSM